MSKKESEFKENLKNSSFKKSNTEKKGKFEIVFPKGMLQDINDYLFNDLSREYCCYLLCGHVKVKDKLRFLPCYLAKPDSQDYIMNSLTGVKIKQEYLISILNDCSELGLSLIDIHSHPFSDTDVFFSGIDEADEREKADWFIKNLPKSYYGSIVMGKRSHKSRLRVNNAEIVDYEIQIKSLDLPLRTASNTKENNSRNYFERQITAFGREGQKELGNYRFSIVGLGGLGAGLSMNLARLGVNKFILIDYDKVELTNLNRLDGSTHIDAIQGTFKVDMVARNLLQIDSEMEIEIIKSNILKRYWKRIINSDIIIVATDNHISRMFINRISQQYLIPCISIGTNISTDRKYPEGYGHIFISIPGQEESCLSCSEIFNPVEAYYELTNKISRKMAFKAGYIENFDEPSPSVCHLNGVIINLALIEIHNLFTGFKAYGKHIIFDMNNLEINTIDSSGIKCSTCSSGGGIFAHGDLINPQNDLLPKFN